ncbi:hypothetical protein [Salinifilum ghardaiensis]
MDRFPSPPRWSAVLVCAGLMLAVAVLVGVSLGVDGPEPDIPAQVGPSQVGTAVPPPRR